MTSSTMTAAAHLAAKLLAHRQTSQDEVGDLIRNVHGALTRLGETPPEAVERAPVAREPRPTRAPRKPRAERHAVSAAQVDAPAEPSAPPPPAPKLVRRAEMMPAQAAAPMAMLAAPSHGTVRGVVRWFDPKSGKGALRLPGLGDVAFEARLLQDSGITRLFKGQEIEATLAEGNGAPQLQHLSLPGTVAASPLGSGGMVKSRHAKPVIVELKREALRRAAARAEAEHVLGPSRSREPAGS